MADDLRAASETNLPLDASATVITNLAQFWSEASDTAEQNRLHRVQMELLIYYCDTNWTVFWGESGHLKTFLPLRGLPVALKSGQKILVDGWALPVNQEFAWDKTSVRVLSQSNAIECTSAQSRLLNADELKGQFVEISALVDSTQSVTSSLLKLNLLTDNLNVTAYVHLDEPVPGWPDWSGKIIQIHGVYAATLDSVGKVSGVVLWSPGLDQIKITGSLAEDPRFSIPLVASDQFGTADPKALIRVAGLVHAQQPGGSVTLWDGAGQIRVLAQQRQPLQLGDQIEAIGYPEIHGIDRILRSGLFRVATNNAISTSDSGTNVAVLPLADQVRGLDQESLATHPPVNLQGMVTCVDTQTNFIYVEDSSGGIRVMQGRLQSGRRIRPGMLVTVKGNATMGEFTPVITNAVVYQTGTTTLPDAPLVSLEQALTGTEDGHWIEMRGYVRRVVEKGKSLDLQLVAPGGEFVAHVPEEDPVQSLQGSVVLVRGVCVAIANSRHQLTGIEICSTVPGSVQVEQHAPGDLFAQPQRSIASLRQFSLLNTLNRRVRTSGTVTLQEPGRYLYLQDGENSLFALSSQTDPLRLGDRVEIVGFSGNDNGRFLLREASYRRISGGPEPQPVRLTVLQNANEELDGLLVRIEGLLLEIVKKTGETRLVIQAGGRIFEARLDSTAPLIRAELLPDTQLAVTGVYRIQRDEYGKPSSFLLHLRSVDDVTVLAPPPWWTPRRISIILAVSFPAFFLALFWALQTRRKNQLLQRAQVALKTAHAQLEERVAERTQELNDESEARKRALVRLSEAQQRLMLASRQAGMAEVATGILHNVGNILNSVNVSASVIGDSLQRLRIEKFCKAVEMLTQQNGNLATFLAEDPRGRALPGYLQQLAGSMAQNEQTIQTEVKSLTKQIDHVKAVVAWQQGYARSSGFYESLNPVELMEDALQINHGAYERHGIEIIREYDDLPVITADRHKILQILINFLSNAKQALAVSKTGKKQVVLKVCLHDKGLIRFQVSDTGVGVPPENLERIFSLGFTTKANGHGFGLHSGANSAKEMGGRLFVQSDGIEQGATFVLELPVAPKVERHASLETEAIMKTGAEL